MKSHILHPIKKFFVLNLVGISFCLLALRMDGRVIKGIVRFISSSLLKLNVLIKHNICFLMKNVAICNSTCPPLLSKFAPEYVTIIYSYCFKAKYTIQIIISHIMTYIKMRVMYCLSLHVCVDYLWEFGNTSTTTFFRQKPYRSLRSGPAHCMNVNTCMSKLWV